MEAQVLYVYSFDASQRAAIRAQRKFLENPNPESFAFVISYHGGFRQRFAFRDETHPFSRFLVCTAKLFQVH
jgi:hypothetical protein